MRPAVEEDLSQLVEIEKRCHRAPWTRDHFLAELQKDFARLYVLTDDETDTTVHAYICFWLLDECSIQNVVVDLSSRGMGYGEKLVRQAVNEALKKALPKVRLEVRKSNDPAVQLYQKVGFTICRVQKSFYSDGEDAYVMELDLTGQELGADF